MFFEKVEVDDDVRYSVFVYLLDGSICEEVLYPSRQSLLGLFPWGREIRGAKSGTYHEALCDIRRCCAIRLVLVRLADLQRVDDGREPVDELVEVHARCGLARRGRPVVLGETEEVVQLGVDEGGDPRRRARLGLLEGRRGREADCAAALGRARKLQGVEAVGLVPTGEYIYGGAHRRAVKERSSSALATSKCSRLVIICATWESVDVFARLPQ